MKKKIFLSLLFAIIALIAMKGTVSATNCDNKFFSYYIPNNYKIMLESEKSNSIFKGYSSDDNYINNIVFYTYVYDMPLIEQYNEKDLDEEIKRIEDSYLELYNDSNNHVFLKSIKGNMVELNGVKGFRITYYEKDYSIDFTYGYDRFYLRSDNSDYYVFIKQIDKFINSAEENKIINSFKIKDTVLKSRNIPFIDVPTKSWYFDAVKYVYENNIVSGLKPYIYGSNDKLTRGQLVTILYKMENSPSIYGTSKFKDVNDSSKFYYKAVLWASNNKIVSGYSNGNFGPTDNITRQDLAVIFKNYATYKKKDISKTNNLDGFSDRGKISNYALSSMKWAVGAGVITGNAKTKTLNPKGNATRAEVAAMVQKYCKNVGR